MYTLEVTYHKSLVSCCRGGDSCYYTLFSSFLRELMGNIDKIT